MESGRTLDSLSSRGDLFPSDEEDDAIPLDDEFAMVLERRTTQSSMSGLQTETSSGRARSERKLGKRPSTGSRTSTRRTMSTRSVRSSVGSRKVSSRRGSSTPEPVVDEAASDDDERVISNNEAVQNASQCHDAIEPDAEGRRIPLHSSSGGDAVEIDPLIRTTAQQFEPSGVASPSEPSQLPTPVATDDEDAENAGRTAQPPPPPDNSSVQS